MSNVEKLSSLYAEFLAGNESMPNMIVSVQTSVDPDLLMDEYRTFFEQVTESSAVPPVLLLPRKFDTLWMADRYCYHMNEQIGTEVWLGGISIGTNNKREQRHHSTITITDYKHSLDTVSGTNVLQTASVIILCDTQDYSIDAAIVTTLIYNRIRHGDRLFVVLLSQQKTNRKWDDGHDDDQIYGGITHRLGSGCDQDITTEIPQIMREIDDVETLLSLISQSKHGIVICVSDQRTARRVERTINQQIADGKCSGNVEVVVLYQYSTLNAIHQALTKPGDGMFRVVINVGVLELPHIVIPWIDTVVSDGTWLQPVGRLTPGGSVEFGSVVAPTWYFRQQMKISGVVDPTFQLLCTKSLEPMKSDFDLGHVSPTSPIFVTRAAEFYLKLLELEIDYTIDSTFPLCLPDSCRFMDIPTQAASLLKNLGLITITNDTGNTFIKLNSDDRVTGKLPLGIYSKAALRAAIHLDIVAEMLPIIAMMEIGGVRRVASLSHGLDKESDLFDTTIAFARALSRDLTVPNLNTFRVQQADRLMSLLQKRCRVTPNLQLYQTERTVDDPLWTKIKACLFVSSARTFRLRGGNKPMICDQLVDETLMGDYVINKSSVVASSNFTLTDRIITGTQRMFRSQAFYQKGTATIEWVTIYRDYELYEIVELLPTILRWMDGVDNTRQIYYHDNWVTSATRRLSDADLRQLAADVIEYADMTLIELADESTSKDKKRVPTEKSSNPITEQVNVDRHTTSLQQGIYEAMQEKMSQIQEEVHTDIRPVASTEPKKTKPRQHTKPVSQHSENPMHLDMAKQLAEAWGASVKPRSR